MAKKELGRWEVSEFAAAFGQRPDHELAYLSNVFCNPEADWRAIRHSIPETITVKSVVDGFPSQTFGERYHTVFKVLTRDAYRAILMPQVESLGLLASTGNELFTILAEIINLSKEMPPLVRYGLDSMEVMLLTPFSPSEWDNGGRLPSITGSSKLIPGSFSDDEQMALVESARVIGGTLGEGPLYKFARLLVQGGIVSADAVERYWRSLDQYYRAAPHRNSPEEAARIAKLDVTLNAFCAARIMAVGPAEVFDKYLVVAPTTEAG